VPAWGKERVLFYSEKLKLHLPTAPIGTYEEWYWMWLEQDIAAGNGSVLDFHVKNFGQNFAYQGTSAQYLN